MTAGFPEGHETGTKTSRPLCGATTRRGTPCRRPAGPDGHCWMHAGRPARTPRESAEPDGDAADMYPSAPSADPPALPMSTLETDSGSGDAMETEPMPDAVLEPAPFDDASPANDFAAEEIDLGEIEASLEPGTPEGISEFGVSRASDPVTGREGEALETDDPPLEIGADFDADATPGIDRQGAESPLPPAGDEPVLTLEPDLEGDGPVDALAVLKAPGGADEDEPMLILETDLEEDAPEDGLAVPEGPTVLDDDEPMLTLEADFEEDGPLDVPAAPEAPGGADEDEPMLVMETDLEEDRVEEPERALEMEAPPEPDEGREVPAGPAAVLFMADAQTQLSENVFADEPTGKDDFDLEQVETDDPEAAALLGTQRPGEIADADADGDADPGFDLTFGIEIEKPPAPDGASPEKGSEAGPFSPSARPAPLPDTTAPKAEPAWWRRRVAIPVAVLVAVAVLVGIGWALTIRWGERISASGVPAGLRILETDGRVVENIHQGPIFVVRGRVRNDAGTLRRRIDIRGRLFLHGNFVKTVTVPAGHDPSEAELAAMPPDSLLDRLTGVIPGPGGAARLESGRALPFTLVFTDLPEDLGTLEKFTVEVADAVP